MTDTFYTNEAAFDAALQASGAQPTTFNFSNDQSGDYSTPSGFTQSGVTFVGNKTNGNSLSEANAGYYGNDYPVNSLQGPAPTSNYYNIQNGSTSVTLPNGSYAFGVRLFTVQTGDGSGSYMDTVSLDAVDSQGNSSTGTGTTAFGSSYASSAGSGFLGVISSAPITSATLTGSTAEDFVDIAEVTYAGGPSTVSTQTTPTISGTHASATTAEASLTPFTGVTLGDTSPGASDTLTIQLSDAGADGTLSGAGLSGGTDGAYVLAAAPPSTLTSELNALSFTPINTVPGGQSTTTFTLTDQNANGTVTDGNTSVTDTATAAAPVTPAPMSPTTMPGNDALQVITATVNSQGLLDITGNTEGNQGTASIDLSGQVDGNGSSDLSSSTDVTFSGASNQNGNFNLTYELGKHTLSFASLTLNDRAGGSTVIDLPESFSGVPGQIGVTTYDADGSAVLSTTHVKTNGSQTVNVGGSGLTLQSNFFDTFDNHGNPGNTFVFDPGHGLDIVNQFRVNGTDHDSLSFLGSDFGSTPAVQLASVLANTTNTAQGAVITDPTSGDTVLLKGITKAELKANTADITFHA